MRTINFRKKISCAVAAIISLFAVCGNNLHAANNGSPGGVTIAANDSKQNPQESAIPYGVWNVTQVIFEKNTDGNAVTNSYSNVADLPTIIPCPQKWEFVNSEILKLHLPDGGKETLSYTLENGRLVIKTFGAIFYYLYDVNKDNMTLTGTFENGNTKETLIITTLKTPK